MRFPDGLRGLGFYQPGRDISGEGIQLRIGGKRLADPLIKLALSQPSLHERGLERAEHLLAARLRRDQVAAASHVCCDLVSGLDHLAAFP
jgi:hypothetical protein